MFGASFKSQLMIIGYGDSLAMDFIFLISDHLELIPLSAVSIKLKKSTDSKESF